MKISIPTMTLCVCLLLAFLPTHASATDDQAALREASVAWMQAIASKDEPALQAFLAPEFTLTAPGDADARTVRRAEWIGNAVKMDWSRFRFENLRVRVVGDHAVVESRLFFHVSPMPFELDSGVLDTWEKRDGRWQVTGRYLGESQFNLRARAVLGFVAALLLVGVVVGLRRLARRRGSHSAGDRHA